MKILIIHNTYQDVGGEDIVMLNERSLLESAHIVDTLTFKNTKDILGYLNFILYPFNFIAGTKILLKILQFKPDIVHLHNIHYAIGPIAILIIKLTNTPLVMTVHNYRFICPTATLYYNGQIFQDSIASFFPLKAIRLAVISDSILLTCWIALSNWIHIRMGTFNLIDKFIFLSEEQMHFFKIAKCSFPTMNSIIKPNFCSAQDATSLIENRTENFIFIGRLTEEKGVETLLKSFLTTNYHLKIIGTGPLVKMVLEASKTSENITYCGALDHHLIYKELREATSLIFTSEWPETFGMVIIEAFSVGTPVIASRIGAPLNIVNHLYNGLTFEAGNNLELIDAVNLWRGLSAENKIEISKRAYTDWKEKFSPEIALKNLESIYSDALKKN